MQQFRFLSTLEKPAQTQCPWPLDRAPPDRLANCGSIGLLKRVRCRLFSDLTLTQIQSVERGENPD